MAVSHPARLSSVNQNGREMVDADFRGGPISLALRPGLNETASPRPF
jgi:hypothetical protein